MNLCFSIQNTYSVKLVPKSVHLGRRRQPKLECFFIDVVKSLYLLSRQGVSAVLKFCHVFTQDVICVNYRNLKAKKYSLFPELFYLHIQLFNYITLRSANYTGVAETTTL